MSSPRALASSWVNRRKPRWKTCFVPRALYQAKRDRRNTVSIFDDTWRGPTGAGPDDDAGEISVLLAG
ncbi:hypothetical protein [Ensifer canadensis]